VASVEIPNCGSFRAPLQGRCQFRSKSRKRKYKSISLKSLRRRQRWSEPLLSNHPGQGQERNRVLQLHRHLPDLDQHQLPRPVERLLS